MPHVPSGACGTFWCSVVSVVLLDVYKRQAEGYDVTVPILVCNSVEFSSIKGSVGEHVEEMDQLIVARER